MKKYSGFDFPPYAFVPVRNPHPKSNPEGHLYGKDELKPNKIDSNSFINSEEYLYGIDLFNHGFYWEAHEVWESLWNAHNREGNIAEFLKALIRLSAAGVKVKQAQERGIKDHSQAAGKVFEKLLTNTNQDLFLGISLSSLINLTNENINNLDKFVDKKDKDIVFDSFLEIYF